MKQKNRLEDLSSSLLEEEEESERFDRKSPLEILFEHEYFGLIRFGGVWRSVRLKIGVRRSSLRNLRTV